MYGAPLHLHHVKLSFYLDTLRADSGAIRVIPGTNFFNENFATNLRKRINEPEKIASEFGVPDRELPSVPIETDPGDVVAWDFRTIHASFYGGRRRRLFSINFRERAPQDEYHRPGGAHAAPTPRVSSRPAGARALRDELPKGIVLDAIARSRGWSRASDPTIELRLGRLRHAAFGDRPYLRLFDAGPRSDGRSALGNNDSRAPSGSSSAERCRTHLRARLRGAPTRRSGRSALVDGIDGPSPYGGASAVRSPSRPDHRGSIPCHSTRSRRRVCGGPG